MTLEMMFQLARAFLTCLFKPMNLVLLAFLASLVLSFDPALPKHVIPLYGNSTLGYYYANIYVGSPPQEQSVIVDTGSGLLALPCSKCTSCGNMHLNPPFRVEDSLTGKFMTCVLILKV